MNTTRNEALVIAIHTIIKFIIDFLSNKELHMSIDTLREIPLKDEHRERLRHSSFAESMDVFSNLFEEKGLGKDYEKFEIENYVAKSILLEQLDDNYNINPIGNSEDGIKTPPLSVDDMIYKYHNDKKSYKV